MTGETHNAGEEVVVETREELMGCYRTLRGFARVSRNELSFGAKFMQLNDLIIEMGSDILLGNITLLYNMKATVDVSRAVLIFPGKDNSILEHYLEEIQVLIDSYEKHGKDKEDGKK